VFIAASLRRDFLADLQLILSPFQTQIHHFRLKGTQAASPLIGTN